MIRKAIATHLGVAILVSGLLGGCTREQMAENMAYAKQVAAAIKRGAAVTASAVRQGIDAACANQQSVYASAQVARSVLIQQTGPNTIQNIDNLDKSLAAYNQVCAAASDPNTSDLASLLSRAIAAYAAVQAAQAKAGV